MGNIINYITPDPNNPKIGLIRMTNNQMRIVAEDEGFIGKPNKIVANNITLEQRLIVRIIFNRESSILIRKETKDESKQAIVYFHQDGIVAVENGKNDRMYCYCFSCMNDLLEFYTHKFLDVPNKDCKYPMSIEVPTDKRLYEYNKDIKISKKIRLAILNKLAKNSETKEIYNERVNYIDDWKNIEFSLRLFANNDNQLGFLNIIVCKNCIWAIYPYENNLARLKVINMGEAYNKVCEFIDAFRPEV